MEDYLLDSHITFENSAQMVYESMRFPEKCFPRFDASLFVN